MGSVVLTGATSGSTTITPTDAVTVTVTLPSTSGTLQTSGAGFTTNGVAYASSTSALTTGSSLTWDGTNLGVGNASPRTLFDTLSGTANTTGDVLGQAIITGPDVAPGGTGGSGNLVIQTNSNQAANVGGSIAFGGRATDSSTVGRGYAVIKGAKENSTSANRDGYFAIFTRTEASGQTEKLRVDSVGNLGLGVTPSAWGGNAKGIQITNYGSVSGNSNIGTASLAANAYEYVDNGWKRTNGTSAGLYQISYTGAHTWSQAGSATVNSIITFTQAMTLDASGNLLLGTTSSAGRLTINGSTADSTANCVSFRDSSSTSLFIVRDDGRISTGGALSPYSNTTASAANMYVDASGIFYRSTSSLKYKTNVENATHGLADVLKLRPVTYQSKATEDGQIIYGGLIAEEVDAAGLKEFVQYAPDGSPDALAYGNMVSLCIKAIQEQQTLIQSLTNRLTALENK